jgi:2-keto-4-pentenoate hydratase
MAGSRIVEHDLAAEIDAAHRVRKLLDPPGGVFDLDGAYAVQRRLTALRTARGARRVGWKLGYTSAAMREQMGVDAPNFGPLLDTMLVTDGAVPGTLVQPRVEPEVAVVVGADGGPAQVRAALEIVDSVWRGYAFTLELNTADGSSAAGVVLGPELSADDLPALPVTLRRNGEVVGEATAAAAMGHPFTALEWLSGELARRGEQLSPGDVVITGGLTAAVPIGPDEEITAEFGDGIVVVVRGPRDAYPGRSVPVV